MRLIARGVRATSDERAAAFLVGAASVVLGGVCLSWPVLTIEIFALALGAWLFVIGLTGFFRTFVQNERAHERRVPRTRRWARTLLAGGALALAVLMAVGSSTLLRGDQRPAPDEFYSPPASVPETPGTLLRAEALDGVAPDGAQAWRILYTTTLPDGSPAVASGTVLAPVGSDAGPRPLLSIVHGTTGIVPRCAPSLSSAPFGDGAQAAMFEMVTDRGWVAVLSDYVGLGTAGVHPYLVGEAEARSVLDASRAVRQLSDVRVGSETVVWGHSQGGHAALWTGQIARDYAPEITVRGIAALAPATDLFDLAESSKNDIGGKTISAYIAAAWDVAYPELALRTHLTPGTADAVDRIASLCFTQRDALAAGLRGSQLPEQVFPDELLAGGLGEKLRQNTPKGPFPTPVLVAQGTADPLVKPSMQREWVRGRCEAGVELDFRLVEGRGHMELVAAGSPINRELIEWTLARWVGAPPTPNC